MINSNKSFYSNSTNKGNIIKILLRSLLTIIILNHSNAESTINKIKDCDLYSFSIGECYQKCRINYVGERNFFNRTDGICYKTLNCSSNEEYDISTNSCRIRLNEYINNLPNFDPDNFAGHTPSSENPEGKINIPKIHCVNGIVPSKTTLCICYIGFTDSATISKDINNNTSIINKCDQMIEGFSNSSSKNPNTNHLINDNLNSTNSNANAKPGQNIFIPDFIVKNSSLSANGLIDTFPYNNSGKGGNYTSNDTNNSDSSISNFFQNGIEFQSSSVSPVLIIIICISCACFFCCFSCLIYFICRNRKNKLHRKLINTQNFPQFTNTGLNNNNNDFKININKNENENFNSFDYENHCEKENNYSNFQNRQSNLEVENNSNLDNINKNYFFNPQKQRSYNFFEQDLKLRNTHRRNLSNDALLNKISKKDYSSIQHNYKNQNDWNQSFTDYTYTNNCAINSRNIQYINNKLSCEKNKNAYENSNLWRNHTNDISCNNIITSEECYNNIDKSIINKLNPEFSNNDFSIPINNIPNHQMNNNRGYFRADGYLNPNKSKRSKNNYINSHFKLKEPIKMIPRENPEKRELINPMVGKKLNFEDYQNFPKNICFSKKNADYFRNDSQNVNYEYISENTNNVDTSINLKNNIRLAELNKFKNQGNSYSYYRPSTLIFRKGKGSKSMDITNRTESYFLGEDISEEENKISIDKGNNTFNEKIPNTFSNRRQNFEENNPRIRNRSKGKILFSKNNDNINYYNFKNRSSSNDYYIDKYQNIPLNVFNNFGNPLKDTIKKRSKSTRIINSNYLTKLNKSNSFNNRNNKANLSNGIKSINYHPEKDKNEFYYNEDLDENSGVDTESFMNANNKYFTKINSIRHFDKVENNILNNNTQQNNSSANNNYFNNNFLNTNFHEETENCNNNNFNNYISDSRADHSSYENHNNNDDYTNIHNAFGIINNGNNSKIFSTYKKQRRFNNAYLKILSGNKFRSKKKNFAGFYSDDKILKKNKRNSVCFDIQDENHEIDKIKNSNFVIPNRKSRKSLSEPIFQQFETKINNLNKSSKPYFYQNENGNEIGFTIRKKIRGIYGPMQKKDFSLKYIPEGERKFKFNTSIKKPIKRRLTYNDY